MEPKKAYGLVNALGAKLGEKARGEPTLVDALREAPDLPSLRGLLARELEGVLAPILVAQFNDEVLDEASWTQWRARLLLHVKMVRDGAKPAPGHEAGKTGQPKGRP